MPYHVRDERQPVCKNCGKPMTEWRASDECLPKVITVAICGPGNQICKCNCPDSCEHVWDGPGVEFDEGRGGSVSCSRCGMLAIDHDIWAMP